MPGAEEQLAGLAADLRGGGHRQREQRSTRQDENGIIMVANLNRVRDTGVPLFDAVLTGATERLRPVLMTAAVATVGMLPAASATGIGSNVQRDLATVVSGGLILATLLTLFVVPTFYFAIELHVAPHFSAAARFRERAGSRGAAR